MAQHDVDAFMVTLQAFADALPAAQHRLMAHLVDLAAQARSSTVRSRAGSGVGTCRPR